MDAPRLTPLWDRLLGRAVAASGRPVVVGPWYGEAGLEALYWLPYITGWLASAGIESARTYVITRGGAGCWYPVVADQQIDLYVLRPIVEVRRQLAASLVQTGMLKPRRMTTWDGDVVRQASAMWGLRRPFVLHPHRLVRRFGAFWRQRAPLSNCWRHTDWRPLGHPAITESTLPPRYYAVRWYARATWPAGPEMHAFLARWLHRLAEDAPVIVLEQPHHLDDHVDFPVPSGPQIHRLPPVPPEQTLSQQTAVLHRATAIMGTYGGLIQVALRLGRPSWSWYETLEGTLVAHLELSQALAVRTQTAFTVMARRHHEIWPWPGR